MVAIQYGLSGPSVLYLVEMGVVAVHGLVPILHRALMEKIAHNWDLKERLKNAMLNPVQWMEVMARGKSGASVLKLAEQHQAQRDELDCATIPNHRMVVKIALP